jgi:hypothetical protein
MPDPQLILGGDPYASAAPTPEELEASRQQMTSARKFLHRDLLGEAQKDTSIKNPLLRILAGIGEGVQVANNPKYKTGREKRYDELLSEYQRQAPIMQRDVAQYETNQSRNAIEAAKNKTKQEEIAAKAKANADVVGYKKLELDQKYKVFTEGEKKAIEADVDKKMAEKGLTDAKMKTVLLENAYMAANDAKMGTASPQLANASVQLKNPNLLERMQGNDSFMQKLKTTGKILENASKPAGGGAGGTAVSDRTGYTYQNVEGKWVKKPTASHTERTTPGRAAPSPQQTQQLLDTVNKTFGAGAATAPIQGTFPTGKASPFGAAAPPQAPQGLGPVAPPQGPPASPLQQRLQPPPPAPAGPPAGLVPEVVGDAPKKRPTAEQQQQAAAHMSMKMNADRALMLLTDPDKEMRKGINARTGDVLGSVPSALIRRLGTGIFGTKDKNDPDIAMDKILQSSIENLWEKVVAKSGKTVTRGELGFGEASTVRMNSMKTGITDSPDRLVSKLIGQRIFVAVSEMKNDIYDNVVGSDQDKQEAVRQLGDFSKQMEKYQNALILKYKNGGQITGDDFKLEKILPGVAGNDNQRALHEFQNRPRR